MSRRSNIVLPLPGIALRPIQLQARPADFALRTYGWPAELVERVPAYYDPGNPNTHARGSK